MITSIIFVVIFLLMVAVVLTAIGALLLQEGPLVTLLILLCPVGMFAPPLLLQGVFSSDSRWISLIWAVCAVGIPLTLYCSALYISERSQKR